MNEQDLKQDVGVVSLAIHARGIQEVHTRGRDTFRKVGPHDTEGVRCTLARFHRSCMGIYFGVTLLGIIP